MIKKNLNQKSAPEKKVALLVTSPECIAMQVSIIFFGIFTVFKNNYFLSRRDQENFFSRRTFFSVIFRVKKTFGLCIFSMQV